MLTSLTTAVAENRVSCEAFIFVFLQLFCCNIPGRHLFKVNNDRLTVGSGAVWTDPGAITLDVAFSKKTTIGFLA